MESIMSVKPISMGSIRPKMTPLGLPILFLMACSSVPSVVAQFSTNYNCEKYCFASCSDYFPGPEFSPCVSANVHCSCHTKVSAKNPFVLFIIVACIFVTLFCCGLCYRLARHNNRNSRPSPHRTIAHPVVNAAAGNNNRRSSNNNTSANTNSNISQGGLRGFTNPLAPQKSEDVPPEYLAPPPYNECVIDMNSQEKIEKF